MKGFGVLLALASVSLLLFCGPPALASGDHQNYVDLQNASIATATDIIGITETPALPAQAQVVLDPGRCDSQVETLTLAKMNILPAVRIRNIFRQGVRLLNFLPFC